MNGSAAPSVGQRHLQRGNPANTGHTSTWRCYFRENLLLLTVSIDACSSNLASHAGTLLKHYERFPNTKPDMETNGFSQAGFCDAWHPASLYLGWRDSPWSWAITILVFCYKSSEPFWFYTLRHTCIKFFSNHQAISRSRTRRSDCKKQKQKTNNTQPTANNSEMAPSNFQTHPQWVLGPEITANRATQL